MNDFDLENIGKEVCRLLLEERYESLVKNYGYALAFDKDPAQALRMDFREAIGCDVLNLDGFQYQVDVKRFYDNSIGIVALVECLIISRCQSKRTLVELIFNKNEKIYIEQVSSLA